MKKEMNFKILETITNRQNSIRNHLFLFCAKKAVNKAKGKSKIKRKEQFDELKKSMPEFSHSDNSLQEEHITKQWWDDEAKQQKEYSSKYEKTVLIESLFYRLLSVFFLNHIHCPFYTEKWKGKKTDNKDFNEENQKTFKRFLNQSIKLLSSHKKFQPIIDILPLLRNGKKINIFESIGSATYELNRKDRSIAKGLLFGGTTGAVTGVFLGPVIGGYIGKLAGFSGAVATNYGLALLGGGSLASGGFGMLGGKAVLGIGFGMFSGIKYSAKNASIGDLNAMQAQRLLPVLLAIGRAQFEPKNKAIPKLIHNTVSKQLKKFEERLNTLEKCDKISDSIDKKILRILKNQSNQLKNQLPYIKKQKICLYFITGNQGMIYGKV